MSVPEDREDRLLAFREAVGESEVVPGFPEIKRREHQCRLCRLVEDDPKLLAWIHDLKGQGLGVRALETQTKAKWEERSEVPLDHRCFHRHFKNHVDLSALGVAVGTGVETAQAGKLQRAAAELVSEIDQEVFGTEDDDFFEMKAVIDRLKNWVGAIDDKGDGNHALLDDTGKLDSYKLVVALKLVDSLRAAIKAFHDMKNSERIGRLMLKGQTKRYAREISLPLVEQLKQVRDSVEAGEAGDALAQLDALLSAELRDLMVEAATVSLQQSYEAYKIH